MSAPYLIRKFRRNLIDYGVAETLVKSFWYVTSPLCAKKTYRIYRVDINGDEKDAFADPAPAGIAFKMLRVADDSAIRQIEEMAEWLMNTMKRRLASGKICLVGLDGDVVAGFNLVAFNAVYIPLIHLEKRLREGCAWSEDIYVHKAYRGSGLASQLRFRIYAELHQRGIKRLYGGTLVSNRWSLQSAKKTRFKQLADIHYTSLLGSREWRYERVR